MYDRRCETKQNKNAQRNQQRLGVIYDNIKRRSEGSKRNETRRDKHEWRPTTTDNTIGYGDGRETETRKTNDMTGVAPAVRETERRADIVQRGAADS